MTTHNSRHPLMAVLLDCLKKLQWCASCRGAIVSIINEAGMPALQVSYEFELGNSVWAKAKILPTKAVNLWLGADVMVEYPVEEAQQLLVRMMALSGDYVINTFFHHLGVYINRHQRCYDG